MAAAKGANEKDQRPIIVRRVKKVVGHGHHGGAWKVAYADFVTAMMAFFLVMWLMAVTTAAERGAISSYFSSASPVQGKSPTPAPAANGPGGASSSMIKLGGTMDLSKGDLRDMNRQKPGVTAADQARQKQLDQQRLEQLRQDLQQAISKSQALEPFKDQLLLDITPEGLRIQIVDKQNRPMFDLGGSVLKPYTTEILHELAHYIEQVPNHISITGHTDTTLYNTQNGYTNWELSADRANAARRTLMAGGLSEDKIARVVGLGSSVLFDKANPQNPINRRISIVVMSKEALDASLGQVGDGQVTSSAPVADPDAQAPSGAAPAR